MGSLNLNVLLLVVCPLAFFAVLFIPLVHPWLKLRALRRAEEKFIREVNKWRH